MMAQTIVVKRVYDPVDAGDGYRVLVDRLWPRGLSKEKACVDYWAKEVAPSTALRKWLYGEQPDWEDFKARYEQELANNTAVLALVEQCQAYSKVTLLFATRNVAHTHAHIVKHHMVCST